MPHLGGLLSRVILVFTSVLVWTLVPLAEVQAQGGSSTMLPLTEVVLYSSGVGYFQRDGSVDGNQQVELRFKVDRINDLLKSMVVQDFDGGQVSTVTYDSRDPITKTLKSFAIDLTTNPSLGALLGQLRGENVEVATPNPVSGVIIGVEKKKEPAGEDKVVEVEYLNVLTGDGLRSLPLSQLQRIQLTNDVLRAELEQALTVLATGHDTQKKTVSLAFTGDGHRRVRIAYLMETPVWKTSYRLVLADSQQPFLQGWAIVENTTDEDWQNVQLSLISGRPISFTMDLYEPLYVQRPVVVPDLYTSLSPQVYGDTLEEAEDMPPPAPLESTAGRGEAYRERAKARRLTAMAAVAEPEMPRADFDLQQGVSSAAQATELGELFRYAISSPVSLARQKSALLPIVNEAIEGSAVSLYNESVHTKHPLNGFRLKNVTSLHLMQGPITVFDEGIYAGDSRIEDWPPGQERLISYAIDLKTEVEPLGTADSTNLISASLRKGTLVVMRRSLSERVYTVKNRDQKQKLVLIEHPFRAAWQLVEPSEATERTREVYRFAITVDAGQQAQLRVREEKPLPQIVQLTNAGPDVIALYVQAEEVSPTVKEALQQVLTLRNRLDQTAAQRQRHEQGIAEITQEQPRIRENMTRLAQNSSLYNRYVSKLDEQETEIEKLRQEIESLKTTEETQKRELDEYLLDLDIS